MSSKISLNEIFAGIDESKNGTISNNQFKHKLRALALGVTSKELDLLISFCDDGRDGRVNYREFIRRFAPLKTEKLLQKRNIERLKIIKE